MAPTPADSSIDTTSVVVLPSIVGLSGFADDAVIEVLRQADAVSRRVDAITAAAAGEIARRSDRALGHSGLAARLGASTPEAALQQLTGVSLTEAKALTTMGAVIGAETPWLAPVLDSVADGSLSIASAAAITRGLGAPTETVAADDLLDAATDLVDLAKDSTPECTAESARNLREQLDAATIADREAHRFARRSLKWFEQADGMTRMVGLLDPESAAIITGAINTVMSPRRGGPRFVDPDDTARAAAAVADPRTNDQYAVDTLVEIVSLATRAATTTLDPAKLFGGRSPAVRVHVQADTLRRSAGAGGTGAGSAGAAAGPGAGGAGGTGASAAGDANGGGDAGAAYFEGQSALVSVATAERYICTSGTIPVIFSGTTAIDVGATHRLHSPRQRVAIAAQWNGCAWPNCPRSSIMAEVHHIDAFNGTNTTLDNAIPLCRFHHMQLHANRWRITRGAEGAEGDDGHTYWLSPPQETAMGEAHHAVGFGETDMHRATNGSVQLRTKNPFPS